MECVKTGMSIRYREDGSHVYPADSYECPNCFNRVAVSPGIPYHDKEPTKTDLEEDIWMDKED